MSNLKIYLATGAREYLFLLLLCNVKQILVSYEYPEPYSCKKILKQNDVRLMVDSGAFSAWSKGKIIKIDEYIEFIKRNHEVVDPERIVNLDIILGGRESILSDKMTEEGIGLNEALEKYRDRGMYINKSNPEEFEEACKKGFENYYYMKEKLQPYFDGKVDPIHVFHQGDDFKWLHKMLKECTYIGVSPNNDETDDSKDKWLMECFKMIQEENPNIKTHAFGVTSKRLLEKFPYTTADSSSWALTSAFGSILTPIGRFVVSDESKGKAGHIDMFPLEIQKKVDEYIRQFGFGLDIVRKKYKYRNIINIFFFTQMEEEIRKSGHSFEQYNRQTSLFDKPTKEQINEVREKLLINDVL